MQAALVAASLEKRCRDRFPFGPPVARPNSGSRNPLPTTPPGEEGQRPQDARASDIELHPGKIYIRIHNAEFVAGTMAKGVSLAGTATQTRAVRLCSSLLSGSQETGSSGRTHGSGTRSTFTGGFPTTSVNSNGLILPPIRPRFRNSRKTRSTANSAACWTRRSARAQRHPE